MESTATDLELEEIRQRVRDVERRMEALRGDTDPDAESKAQRLEKLECELIGLTHEVRRVEADYAHHLGDPVAADASHWRDLSADLGLAHAAQAADGLVADLLEDHVAAWREEIAPVIASGDADACFKELAKATALDREALRRRPGQTPLDKDRAPLRAAALAAMERNAPSAATRRRWSVELADRADVVLAGVDDLPPDQARAHLSIVEADVDWHMHHVETRRGRQRARLRWKRHRLRSEAQERGLQHRLYRRFGENRVRWFDRVILLLIFFVLGLLIVELTVPLSDNALVAITVLDSLACCVFLYEIAVKLRMVTDRLRWLLRHLVVDVIPSIPFGLLLWNPAFNNVQALRALRVQRFMRLMRYFRAFGFLARGMDRMVRAYGFVLNRNLVLYPTKEERAKALREERGLDARLRRVEAQLNERWERLLTTAPEATRAAVALARINGMRGARAEGWTQIPTSLELPPVEQQDIPAEHVLRHLASITGEEVESELGEEFVVRVARAVRIFSIPPIRWLPILRRFVPRTSRGMTAGEVTAAAARRVAREFKRNLDRWFWFADLYGTVTPAQFVDRVGTTMVKGTFRPAYKLVLFGLLYGVIAGAFEVFDVGLPHNVKTFFDTILGTFLIVLGSVCFIFLGIGIWLRRVAGEATAFFAQSAKAQFLALTESIKGRSLERDAALFDRRVIAPEVAMQQNLPGLSAEARRSAFMDGVRRWLMEAQAGGRGMETFDALERCILLYRDSLDGSLLTEYDTRTTSQLLGNPALRNLRLRSRRVHLKERVALRKLDLENQSAIPSGPYLWFNLVCQAISHGVARLIVDYNRHAIPLRELAQASEPQRLIYEKWKQTSEVQRVPSLQVFYVTTAFTALHFLDDDLRRDHEVRERFGTDVLERMRRDRRLLFRRVFGTYPLHKKPRDQRVVNIFRYYHKWLSGGRMLLVPLVVVWHSFRFGATLLKWLGRCIREIRRPRFETDLEAAEGADFATAVRKIDRMRRPIVEACILLRARVDPEYLGVRLPGTPADEIIGADADSDLDFLKAEPEFAERIEDDRQRAARDIVRLGRLIQDGLWSSVVARLGIPAESIGREHLRAAAVGYVADIDGIRRHLSSTEILSEVYAKATRRDALPPLRLPRLRLYRAFRSYWSQFGTDGRAAKKAAWRATLHNVWGVAEALMVWTRLGHGAREEGERRLADLLRHPDRITDQLVTLRAIQTLAMLDVLNYREHVFRLGEYEDLTGQIQELLTLGGD